MLCFKVINLTKYKYNAIQILGTYRADRCGYLSDLLQANTPCSRTINNSKLNLYNHYDKQTNVVQKDDSTTKFSALFWQTQKKIKKYWIFQNDYLSLQSKIKTEIKHIK